MALTTPIFNLEENLDIYLKGDFIQVQNMKSHIEGIVEDDLIEQLQFIERQWIDFLGDYLDPSNNSILELEIFYIIKLLKKYTITVNENSGTKDIIFPVGSKLLIPQSVIDLNKTTNMQLEPNAYVIEFNYDYTVTGFISPEEMMEQINDFVFNKSNSLITLQERKINLYEDSDVRAILTILKSYYKVEETEYNINSIRNILSSAISTQVVFSKLTNRKIEISMAQEERKKIICVTYNRTKREVREFKF